MDGKRGQVILWFVFVIMAFVIIVISAVLAPAGVQFTTVSYLAGEKILNNSLDDINNIQDEAIKASINGTVNSAKAATEDNIAVNSAIFQYGWIIVVVLVGLVLFMLTRQLVDVGQGRGLA